MTRRGAAVAIVAAALVAGSATTTAGTAVGAAPAGSTATRTSAPTQALGTRQVVIRDITVRVPHQRPVSAYLVRPVGLARHSAAGIMFLHWLGQIHNDRTEYLGEAVDLAHRGVVSILPQGYFPWVPDPDGTTRDVTRIRHQVRALQSVLDRLVAQRGVDRSRIAVVGHDYGAMYGSLLADRDDRVSTLVLDAPDSTWGNWFAKFWLGLEGQARDDYLATFDGLDPVDHVSRLGNRVLFQWAGQDVFITPEVEAAFAAANPDAQVLRYPTADHQLTDRAMIDRDTFLTDQLGLPTP